MDSDFDGEEFCDAKQALGFFNMLLDKWLKELGEFSDYYLVISNGPNFRKDLFADYKANRKDIKPHPSFAALKEAVKELNGCVWEDGIEADDLIGIRCSESKDTIAVSADKDFATVPCRLMIPTSHGRKTPDFHTFTEDQANHNWMVQAMTGDVIDNYKGIPGIGPKKAALLLPRLEPVEDLWHRVASAFVMAGKTEEDALQMVRLARILRDGDYDFDTKKVKLWTPEKKTNCTKP